MQKEIFFKNESGAEIRSLWYDNGAAKTIVFLHGLKSSSTNHPMVEKICAKIGETFNILKIDFMGCGMSSGKFSEFTITNGAHDVEYFINNLVPKNNQIIVFARSLGAAVAAKYMTDNPGKISKIFLHAPGLNIKTILRWRCGFYHGRELNWLNWQTYFPEEEYQKIRQTREEISGIPKKLNIENGEDDFQDAILALKPEQYLVAHGDVDLDVPITCNDRLPSEQVIKVAHGDHKLLEQELLAQYFDKMINFILN